MTPCENCGTRVPAEREYQLAVNRDYARAYREAEQAAQASELVSLLRTEAEDVANDAPYLAGNYARRRALSLAESFERARQLALRDATELYLLRRGLDPRVTAEELATTRLAMDRREEIEAVDNTATAQHGGGR